MKITASWLQHSVTVPLMGINALHVRSMLRCVVLLIAGCKVNSEYIFTPGVFYIFPFFYHVLLLRKRWNSSPKCDKLLLATRKGSLSWGRGGGLQWRKLNLRCNTFSILVKCYENVRYSLSLRILPNFRCNDITGIVLECASAYGQLLLYVMSKNLDHSTVLREFFSKMWSTAPCGPGQQNTPTVPSACRKRRLKRRRLPR